MSALLLLKTLIRLQNIEKSKDVRKSKKRPEKLIFKYDDDDKICRICCEDGCIPIFDNDEKPNIAEEIMCCSDMNVHDGDGLPKWICDKCMELLQYSVKFRAMCNESIEKLRQLQAEQSRAVSDPNDHLDGSNDGFDEAEENSSHHTSETQWDDSFTPNCLACQETFNDMDLYRRHLPKCNRSIINKDQNITHRKTQKAKKSKDNLCEICGKSFRSSTNLVTHRSTHKNVFPFKCDECPYRGRTRDLLKIHKRSHLTVKPYMCSKCSKTFSTASNLSKHRLLHEDKKLIQCSFCEKTFLFKYRLRAHIKEMHVGRSPVDCNICGKRYNTKKALRGHRLRIHNIKADRIGRLPAYLQFQTEENIDASTSHNSSQDTLLPEQ